VIHLRGDDEAYEGDMGTSVDERCGTDEHARF
jgi:hypothetical protein